MKEAISPSMIIVKLGGSVITDKNIPFKPRIRVIKQLARQIKLLHNEDFNFILIHGGGSFGHPVAKKYGFSTKEGLKNSKQKIGFTEVKLAMQTLNNIIVKIFLEEEIPLAPFHTSSLLYASKGRIIEIYIKPIIEACKLRMIPLLYGDIVLDKELGFSIISGDQIAYALASKIQVDKVIFGTDVDGLYTSNPKIDKKAKLIKRIKIHSNRKISFKANGKAIDVTGGILEKVKHAIKIAELGIPVIICNLVKENNLVKVLKNETDNYTLITT